MKQLQTTIDCRFGQLRWWKSAEGEVQFLASDVAKGLGFRDAHNMTRMLDEDEKGTQIVSTPGGGQQMTVITEAGFYHAAMRSRVEKAKEFRRWVTHEVLPQIRRTGGYIPLDEEDDEKVILCKALMIYKRTIEEKNSVIASQTPKVNYCDRVLLSADCLTTTQVAKELGMTAIELNLKLCNMGIQYHQSGQYMLYAKYARMKLAQNRTHFTEDSMGQQHTHTHLVWTQRGREFIHSLLDSTLTSSQELIEFEY